MPDNLKVMITRDLLEFFESDIDFSRQEGFALQVVEDGLEAWQHLDHSWPNLVMIDLNAAGMPGDELCRLINKDPQLRHIPVMLMVESGNPEDLNRCLKARCADILFKPLSKHLLMAAARRILGLPYRSFPRIPMYLEVRYGVNAQAMQSGYCVNLCSGGMFLETKQPPSLEQLLHVELLLPGTTSLIACQASVAWINTEQEPANRNLPPGIGLQFLSLELNDLLAICRYIRLRTDQP